MVTVMAMADSDGRTEVIAKFKEISKNKKVFHTKSFPAIRFKMLSRDRWQAERENFCEMTLHDLPPPMNLHLRNSYLKKIKNFRNVT